MPGRGVVADRAVTGGRAPGPEGEDDAANPCEGAAAAPGSKTCRIRVVIKL